MQKMLQLIALFSAAVSLIAIISLIVIYSSQRSHKPSQQETSTEKPNPEQETKECESFWQRIIKEPIAIITLMLLFATFLLALSSFIQLGIMKRAEHIAQKTANAANKSAEVAEKTLIATQRPWIEIIDMKLNGPTPIIFAAGGINLNMSYQLKNVGITPAVDIKFFYEVLIKDSDQDMITSEKLRDICIEKSSKRQGFHVVAGIVGHLFPNETSREVPIIAYIPISHFEKIMERKIDTFKSIQIVGYVTYKFPFDETIHITGALYLLVRKDGTPIFPAKKDDTLLPDGKARQIGADKLNMDSIWYGYAD